MPIMKNHDCIENDPKNVADLNKGLCHSFLIKLHRVTNEQVSTYF